MSNNTPTLQPDELPDSHAIFAALRDALAGLYPDSQDARVVVDDAGLSAIQISFSARARTNWHHILIAALQRGQLDALLTVARNDYLGNEALDLAYTAYSHMVEQEGKLSIAPHLPEVVTLQTLPTDSKVDVTGDVISYNLSDSGKRLLLAIWHVYTIEEDRLVLCISNWMRENRRIRIQISTGDTNWTIYNLPTSALEELGSEDFISRKKGDNYYITNAGISFARKVYSEWGRKILQSIVFQEENKATNEVSSELIAESSSLALQIVEDVTKILMANGLIKQLDNTDNEGENSALALTEKGRLAFINSLL